VTTSYEHEHVKDTNSQSVLGARFLWTRHRAAEMYVRRSGVASLAARAMVSSTAHHFYDQLLVKEPGTVAPTPWHNDTSYWQLDGSMICSVWLALDEVPKETGVSYVRGSHKWGMRHSITSFSGGGESNYNYGDQSALPDVPDVDGEVAKGARAAQITLN
jgi:ectoine hydroxylase-related dioxygenase (phytanoyl-CoA dioxygenase family)